MEQGVFPSVVSFDVGAILGLGLPQSRPMRGLERQKTRAFLSRLQHTIHIAPLKVFFRKRTYRIVVWLCFDFLRRNRTGGASFIGYHLPQSVSVFVRELFRRSADQLVVAQPGANARRWERIFRGFHNTGNDVL